MAVHRKHPLLCKWATLRETAQGYGASASRDDGNWIQHVRDCRALKDKQKAEVAAAELRGKGDAEVEALRSAAATAEQRVAEAQADVERVATELRDYKARVPTLGRPRCVPAAAVRGVWIGQHLAYEQIVQVSHATGQ